MKQVIEVVVKVIAESEWVEGRILLLKDEEEEGVRESALNLLEVLAVNLPKKKTYKLFLSHIQQLLSQKSTRSIFAGLSVLSRIIEGCADQIRYSLKTIMEFIALGISSSDAKCKQVTI